MRLRELVARNLRRLRHAKGLSQEELADRAGINRNYVGMLEREQHAATISRACDPLGAHARLLTGATKGKERDEIVADIRHCAPVIELKVPAFCAFDDMNHFEELLELSPQTPRPQA